MPFKLPFTPEQASTFAGDVDRLTFYLVAMGTFFTVLIAVMVLGFAVRYRRRSPDQVGERFDGSTLLEVTWTVIPLLIVLFTFAWGAKVYFKMYRPPADAAEYFVIGKQWMWKIQHPTGQREINELHVPIGQPVKLTMTSEDVLHSFFVPAFRTKLDVVPGRYTTMWFTPTKLGRYHIFCAEFCGAEHSRMTGWVTVMDPGAYQDWLAAVAVPSLPAPPGESGEQIFTRLACGSCHREQGSVIGPTLHGIFGTEVELTSGETVTIDESYIRESILDPAAKIVAGYQPVMPSFKGQVSEDEIRQLISYIESLPGAGHVATTGESEGVVR
jgi:cytochrome c oxidase subunit 2